ncbi:PHP domain-containing protein [Candidatus Peregrinibacteria bacterium]|jgi:predicted metal-dependent phosphoesterase TrpH|nr:PHP domain-containing protein [Candidatus Peregrinibacteria bacterium]MBT4055994.1 PHP domain-containing protein [Candidatus Peregrinibacteria bacterium]
MTKAQFHIHIKGDPLEAINYSATELVNEASKKDFKVLAITCHKKIVFPKGAQEYAAQKGILLIRGVEIEIDRQHVLILNAHPQAEEIKDFDDLKQYRENHPESLVIAPHPYFPGPQTLKDNLEKYIDLFDAIEYSYFYIKYKNYNKKTVEIAKKYNKPLVGNSDCHFIKHLDPTYSNLDIQGPLTTQNVFQAIKQNKIEITTNPLPVLKAAKIFAQQLTLRPMKKLQNLYNSPICTNFFKKLRLQQDKIQGE